MNLASEPDAGLVCNLVVNRNSYQLKSEAVAKLIGELGRAVAEGGAKGC